MPLIRNGEFVENGWTLAADDDALPATGDIIVSPDRFRAERDALLARDGKVGLDVGNAVDPDDIADILPVVSLIALHFPAFTDGRAYSQAHHLRAHLNFDGELRATGNVLADQAAFLTRVGFDSFDTQSTQPPDVWRRAAASMSVAYQRGYRGEQANRQL